MIHNINIDLSLFPKLLELYNNSDKDIQIKILQCISIGYNNIYIYDNNLNISIDENLDTIDNDFLYIKLKKELTELITSKFNNLDFKINKLINK